MKKRDLTKGNVTAVMLLFAVPMILGNILLRRGERTNRMNEIM